MADSQRQAAPDLVAVRRACLAPSIVLASALLLPAFSLHGIPLDVPVIAATAFVTAAAGHWTMRAFPRQRAMFVALMILAVGAGVSALGQTSTQYTAVIRILTEAGFVALVVRARSFGNLATQHRLLDVLYVTATVGAASLLLQYVHVVHIAATEVVDPEFHVLRYGGLMGHPNFAAYDMLAAVVARFSDTRKLTVRHGVMLVLLVAATLLTGSRTALIGAGVAIVLAVVITPGRFTWVLSVAWLVPIAGGTVLARFAVLTSGSAGGSSDTSWRLDQWQSALALPHAPFYVKGIGYNRTEELLTNGLAVHSGYVQVLVELGLIGVLGLAAMVVVAARDARANKLLWPTLAYMLIVTSTDPGLLYPSIAYMFLLMYALYSPLSPATSTHRPAPGFAAQQATVAPRGQRALYG